MGSHRGKLKLSQLPTRRSPRFSSAASASPSSAHTRHLSSSSRTRRAAAGARDEDDGNAVAISLPVVETDAPLQTIHPQETDNNVKNKSNSGQPLRRSSRKTTNIYKTPPAPKTCTKSQGGLKNCTALRRSPRFSSAPELSAVDVGGSKKRDRSVGDDNGLGVKRGKFDLEEKGMSLRGGRSGIKAPQLTEPGSGSLNGVSEKKLRKKMADEKVDSVEERGVFSKCLRSRSVKMVDGINLDEKVHSEEERGVFSVKCLRSRNVKMLVKEKVGTSETKNKISAESGPSSGKKCLRSQRTTESALIEYPQASKNRNTKSTLRRSPRLVEENPPERSNLEALTLHEKSASPIKKSSRSRNVETSKERSEDNDLTNGLETNCLMNHEVSSDELLEAREERNNVESGPLEFNVEDAENEPISVISDTSEEKTLRPCEEKEEETTECRFIGKPIVQEEAELRWQWRYELKRQRKGNGWKLNADEEDEIILNVSCHYAQATVGNTVLDIGDCVHVKGDGDKKHVGQILEFFKTTEGEDYCRLQWFFRAEDTVLKDAASAHDKRRLFISKLVNDNLLDCIISKVNVVKVLPKQCLKSIALKPSSYYYDMEYCVDYSTFRTLTPEKSTERQPLLLNESFKWDLKLLDLFSGCGGMSTGLCLGAKISGLNLETKWAVDYDSSACESLRLNHPQTHVRNESAEDFLQLLKQWERLCKIYRCDLEETRTVEEDCTDQSGDKKHSKEYEVSSLVDICYGDPHETGKRGVHFKVRWKGYSPDDDTWEPIKGLSNCKGRIRDFVLKGLQSRILPLPGDADVICGGPPCQGISGYNRHRNFDSPLNDERNRQIVVFMDIVEFLQPRYVLMENVVDIIKFDKGSLGRYALSRLVRMRYQSRLGTIASGCYGLPQFRLRVFIWGAHSNVALPRFPLPTHDVIVRYWPPLEFGRNLVGYDEGQPRNLEKAMVLRDSISDLPWVGNDESREEMAYDKPPETEFQSYIRSGLLPNAPLSRVLYDHRPLTMRENDYMRICQIPRRKGANFRDLPGVVVGPDNVARRDPDMEPVVLPSGRLLVPEFALSFDHGRSKRPYGRLWWDETVSTLVTFPCVRSMVLLHPEQDRVLTVRECARLQGFPDCYRFCGSIRDRYRQIGNAVSVPVARALGYALGAACKEAGGGGSDDEPLMVLPPEFSFSRGGSKEGGDVA